MTARLLGAALLAATCATPECLVDADCIVDDFAGCCGSCCPRAPSATSAKAAAAAREQCARVDCPREHCSDVACADVEPVSAFHAICQARRCTAVRNIISTLQGCCAPHPYAVAAAEDLARQQRCAIVHCGQPRCDGSEVCTAPEPAALYRAICQNQQCTAVKSAP